MKAYKGFNPDMTCRGFKFEEGKNSVAVAWGRESKAKAAKGSYIVLAEYGKWNGKEYPLLYAKMKKVDGKKIKADTFYRLKDGKFVEVAE